MGVLKMLSLVTAVGEVHFDLVETGVEFLFGKSHGLDVFANV